MNTLVRKVVANAPRAFTQPRRTFLLLTRRLFPFRALASDPEAYQAIASWTFGRAPRVGLSRLFPGIEATEVSVMRAFDRGSEASLSASEITTLGAITRHRQPRRILEIGTFEGNTTLNLAANSPPDALVTTVDLPPDWNGELAMGVPNHMVNVTARSAVGRQFAGTEHAPKINQVFADSATLDWGELPGPFDLIFIDGCHFYEYVRADTESALASVARDGIILWHDYGIIEDVSRAVDEAGKRIDIKAIRGTRLAIGFPS